MSEHPALTPCPHRKPGGLCAECHKEWRRANPIKTLGEHIRQYRTDAGFYLGDFARAIGVSVVALSAWERDKKVPSLVTVDEMGKRLGLDREKGSKLYWLAVEALKDEKAAACPTCGHDRRRT